MNILRGRIIEDFHRDLYWTKIVVLSDDEKKRTQIFASATMEYLEDTFKLKGKEKLSEEHLNKWLNEVANKWKKLGEDIFSQDIHYDVYANTTEGEANGLDFLLAKAQNR